MSGTDRLFVVTIIIRQVAKQQIHTTLVIVWPAMTSLPCTSNMEDGLAGMEIDCATIHQSDTSTGISASLIEVLIIPLL